MSIAQAVMFKKSPKIYHKSLQWRSRYLLKSIMKSIDRFPLKKKTLVIILPLSTFSRKKTSRTLNQYPSHNSNLKGNLSSLNSSWKSSPMPSPKLLQWLQAFFSVSLWSETRPKSWMSNIWFWMACVCWVRLPLLGWWVSSCIWRGTWSKMGILDSWVSLAGTSFMIAIAVTAVFLGLKRTRMVMDLRWMSGWLRIRMLMM